MTGTRINPDWTGGASVFAVSEDRLQTIPDWRGLPAQAHFTSHVARVVAQLDRPARERLIQALRLDSAV
jgi:hypothetical protein